MASLIHEFNNPLTAISGFAQLAARTDDTARIHNMIQTIRDECTACSKLLERIENAYVLPPTKLREINVRQILEQSSALGTTLPIDAGIYVEFSLDPELAFVYGDQTLTLRAIQCAMRNAAFAITEVEIPQITLSSRCEDANIGVIGISDNGPGIPPELIEQVFEPTYTTHKSGRGFGLGLPTIRQCMAMQNGEVVLINDASGGLTVELRFPPGAVGY